jgi:hypothetical protein
VQFLHESGLIAKNRPIVAMRGAHLSEADLKGADLSEAILYKADLRDAKGISNEELHEQAKELMNAAMPDGQKYEDWLKSRGEENSGSLVTMASRRQPHSIIRR